MTEEAFSLLQPDKRAMQKATALEEYTRASIMCQSVSTIVVVVTVSTVIVTKIVEREKIKI